MTPVKTNFRNADYSLAQNTAYKVIKDLEIKVLPISLTNVISEYKNLNIQTYDEFANTLNITLERTIHLLQSEDGALWFDSNTNNYVILYNANIFNNDRIRFTIAHELGHFFLKYNEETNQTIISRYSLPNDEYDRMEKEANYFAKRFLAPIPAIDDFLKYKPKINTYDISMIFGMSITASQYVIKNLNSQARFGVPHKKGKLNRLFDPFIKIISTTQICNECKSIEYKSNKFCTVCGSQLPSISDINYLYLLEKNKDKFMKYTEIDLNNGLCPRCHNEVLSDKNFCEVCGTYLKNRCSGITDNESRWEDDPDYLNLNGCDEKLSGKARYCPSCECLSTYYLQGILPNWQEELEQKYKNNNSNLKLQKG